MFLLAIHSFVSLSKFFSFTAIDALRFSFVKGKIKAVFVLIKKKRKFITTKVQNSRNGKIGGYVVKIQQVVLLQDISALCVPTVNIHSIR